MSCFSSGILAIQIILNRGNFILNRKEQSFHCVEGKKTKKMFSLNPMWDLGPDSLESPGTLAEPIQEVLVPNSAVS
jgi:hypothetical protein